MVLEVNMIEIFIHISNIVGHNYSYVFVYKQSLTNQVSSFIKSYVLHNMADTMFDG